MSAPWYFMAKGKGVSDYKSASGPIVSINDALAAPLRSLLVSIDPVQAGTGDPSPDNVRPISGWDGANVWVKPTYDPTANPTATIQLGQTVYGGTLDVTNGVLVVDRRYFVADGDTIKAAAGYGGSGPNWLPIFNVASNPAKGGAGTTVSNYLRETSAVVGTENSIHAANGNQIVLHIGTMQGTDGTHGYNSYQECLAAANAYLVDNPLQVCYKLATPITIPLTPQEISTLQGENNVWADSGNVTVEYLSSGGTDPDLMKLAVAFMGRK